MIRFLHTIGPGGHLLAVCQPCVPALAAVAEPDCDFLLMVKPQFEVGREAVGDGVVREPALRVAAVRGVAEAAVAQGLSVLGVAASPLPGPRGYAAPPPKSRKAKPANPPPAHPRPFRR